MTKQQIVEQLAKERKVERMAHAICRSDRPEIDDLVQICYLALLEKPDELIERAHVEGWLPFFVLNMVKKQAKSDRSTWYAQFRRFQARSVELGEWLKDE